ncbi:PREDICTED: uncharacterized protein LOC104811846 [Tarenaya hassleriana]|uniref:uncharacterized protein LOC104811846 n=1 Tax=Tarenaya hassleriana TaxID=28532 RepID=UPI00053C18CC|nr:PREDICTED: uncharacterized protein LOC104811846 [Tarenaya hassleriana]
MAKNRSKKKRNDTVSMDVSEPSFPVRPEAMDISETGDVKPPVDSHNLRNTKNGKPMKRSKNVRKMKAMVKAIAMTEKYAEKVSKGETKALRTQLAKKLYE